MAVAGMMGLPGDLPLGRAGWSETLRPRPVPRAQGVGKCQSRLSQGALPGAGSWALRATAARPMPLGGGDGNQDLVVRRLEGTGHLDLPPLGPSLRLTPAPSCRGRPSVRALSVEGEVFLVWM